MTYSSVAVPAVASSAGSVDIVTRITSPAAQARRRGIHTDLVWEIGSRIVGGDVRAR